MSLTCRAEAASSPVSGSSSIRKRGSWISAPASATFCRMPLEKPSQRWRRWSRGRGSRKARSARACARRGRDAPEAGDEFQIFDRVELVVELRLVGQPRHQPLGLDGMAPRVDAEHADRPRHRPAAGRRSYAASSSCRRRSAPAARRFRRARRSGRAHRPRGGRRICADRGFRAQASSRLLRGRLDITPGLCGRLNGAGTIQTKLCKVQPVPGVPSTPPPTSLVSFICQVASWPLE